MASTLTQEQIDEHLAVDDHLKPGYVYRNEFNHFLFLGSTRDITYPNIALNFEDAELTALMVGYSKIFCDINHEPYPAVSVSEFLTIHPEYIKVLSEHTVTLAEMTTERELIINSVLKPLQRDYKLNSLLG